MHANYTNGLITISTSHLQGNWDIASLGNSKNIFGKTNR